MGRLYPQERLLLKDLQHQTNNGASMEILFIAVYLTPALIAFWRDVPNYYSILIVNLVIGWTIIGWFVTLGWAFSGVNENK